MITDLLLCSVRLCLQLLVAGFMFYLRYLCLLAYSGVQHILCCVFVLFFFVSCTFCFQFLCIVHFWEVGQWLPSDLETVSGIPVAGRLVSGLPVAWMLVSGFPLAWRLISGFPLTWRPSVDFSGY